MILSDYGTELTLNDMLSWADEVSIEQHYMRARAPQMPNGYMDTRLQ